MNPYYEEEVKLFPKSGSSYQMDNIVGSKGLTIRMKYLRVPDDGISQLCLSMITDIPYFGMFCVSVSTLRVL